MKKTCAIILAAIMLMMAIPFSVMAEEEPVDLAAGKTVTASSTMAGSSTANITDDDRDSFWASDKFENTGTNKSTLEIDLGEVYDLATVKLFYPMFENGINGHSNPWKITIYGKSDANGEWVKIGGVDDEQGLIEGNDEATWWVTAREIVLNEGAAARYVKIELEGMKDDTDTKDAHRICKLTIMDKIAGEAPAEPAEPVDLADGKTITASSTMEGSSTANINDGDRDSFWASDKFENTGTNTSTLEVDLGEVYDLTSVKVFYPLFENGINGHSNPWKITIYGKTEADGEWVKIGGVDDEQGLIEGLEEATWWVSAREIALDEITAARYVKIELEGMKDDTDTSDAHRVCQLTVMGYEDGAPEIPDEPTDPTEPEATDPTEPDPTEPDPTEADPTEATDPTEEPGNTDGEGGSFPWWIVILAVVAVVAVVVVVVLKKRK